jgi:hypothetical protein
MNYYTEGQKAGQSHADGSLGTVLREGIESFTFSARQNHGHQAVHHTHTRSPARYEGPSVALLVSCSG